MVITPCDKLASSGADPLVGQHTANSGPGDAKYASCTDLQEERTQRELRLNYGRIGKGRQWRAAAPHRYFAIRAT